MCLYMSRTLQLYLLPIIAIEIHAIFIQCSWTGHSFNFDLFANHWNFIVNISTAIQSGLLRREGQREGEGGEEGR